MKNPNSVFQRKAHVLLNKEGPTVKSIKQGGSDSEVIICFSTKFEVSADLTVIKSYNRFGITFRHCH